MGLKFGIKSLCLIIAAVAAILVAGRVLRDRYIRDVSDSVREGVSQLDDGSTLYYWVAYDEDTNRAEVIVMHRSPDAPRVPGSVVYPDWLAIDWDARREGFVIVVSGAPVYPRPPAVKVVLAEGDGAPAIVILNEQEFYDGALVIVPEQLAPFWDFAKSRAGR